MIFKLMMYYLMLRVDTPISIKCVIRAEVIVVGTH
jgi:hypothetical protein